MRKSTLFSINVIKIATNNNSIDANLLVEIPKTESIYIIIYVYCGLDVGESNRSCFYRAKYLASK